VKKHYAPEKLPNLPARQTKVVGEEGKRYPAIGEEVICPKNVVMIIVVGINVGGAVCGKEEEGDHVKGGVLITLMPFLFSELAKQDQPVAVTFNAVKKPLNVPYKTLYPVF
jgi:hypothetical protein